MTLELDDNQGMGALLKGIKPIPPDVRTAYEGTEFSCDCGGMVIPQTMDTGVCFSCKATLVLAECDYEEAQ